MATDYTKCSIGFASGNAFDNLATSLSFFGDLLDSMWLRTSSRRVRPLQRRTIGKEHRGYARRSRQRLVQRKATAEQTAKLIELGFEPSTRIPFEVGNDELGRTFSIGELIEMLPEAICTSHDDSCHYHLSMDTDACMWRVRYMDNFDVTLCATYDVDLINALYDMVIVLKRQGLMPND